MITLLPSTYVPQPVTEDDMIIASLAWGFTLGFGWLTTWTALKQTMQMYRSRRSGLLYNPYVWMIWLEILVCLIFSIICWLHLKGVIPPSFAFFFCILTTWALQVQFLLQIIINRCSILLTSKKTAKRLKIGVAILITAINISVYNIWIPARLQISEKYVATNVWWDRCEKVIYLIVDASLNIYFIAIVQRNLVKHGLTKYRSLVRFNIFIIAFSLGMDVLIISMMSLSNTFVYMQFHPLAYMVKLKIEMSMAELIAKVARHQQPGHASSTTHGYGTATERGDSNFARNARNSANFTKTKVSVHTQVDATIRDDDESSIELKEVSKGNTTDSSLHDSASDLNMFPGPGSSNMPRAVPAAIYTTQEVSVNVQSATSSHGDGSFDEIHAGRDDDTRPLRYTTAGAIHTNIWSNK